MKETVAFLVEVDVEDLSEAQRAGVELAFRQTLERIGKSTLQLYGEPGQVSIRTVARADINPIRQVH